ncbi:MAG: hypothetical protein WDW38_011266 [Sanguina aurantia]
MAVRAAQGEGSRSLGWTPVGTAVESEAAAAVTDLLFSSFLVLPICPDWVNVLIHQRFSAGGPSTAAAAAWLQHAGTREVAQSSGNQPSHGTAAGGRYALRVSHARYTQPMQVHGSIAHTGPFPLFEFQ